MLGDMMSLNKVDEDFFNNLKKNGIELNKAQKDAVLCDSEVLQIIAGAGTGKTTTLVSKVKYLVEMKGVKPEKILCLSFSRDSADDLRDKVKKIGLPASKKEEEGYVRVATFHSFGNSFLKQKFIPSKVAGIFGKFLKEEIIADISVFEEFKRFFYYMFNDDMSDSEDGRICYKYKPSPKFDDISRSYFATIDPAHTVQSFYDLKIANFLILNGINFHYRSMNPEIPFENKKLQFDFYLPDYSIYIEDNILDEKGIPFWIKGDIKKREYLDQIQLKEEHFKNTDNLITINSYGGDALDDLRIKLINRNVQLNRIENSKIEEFLEKSGFIGALRSGHYFDKFVRSFKEHNLPTEEIFEYKKFAKNIMEEFFLDIVAKYYVFYKDYLDEYDLIDFVDMIIKATPLIKGTDYEYVLVDEYQDMSKSRFNLLKAILDDSGAKLVVVGDDWQSIYGFNGCEFTYFSNFEDYFPERTIVKLGQSYRSYDKLVKAAGNFVKKDNSLIEKELSGLDDEVNKPIDVCSYSKDSYKDEVVYRILEEISGSYEGLLERDSNKGNLRDVMILARYNDPLKTLEERLNRCHAERRLKLDIKYNTFHRAKGLEAENIIILDVNKPKTSNSRGIPSSVLNEGFLRFVSFFNDKDKQANEERRLFYVGLTRTRNKVYLCCNSSNPSVFINELPNEVKNKRNIPYDENYNPFDRKYGARKKDKSVQSTLF